MLAPGIYLSVQEARAEANHVKPVWMTEPGKRCVAVTGFIMMTATLLGATVFVVHHWSHADLLRQFYVAGSAWCRSTEYRCALEIRFFTAP